MAPLALKKTSREGDEMAKKLSDHYSAGSYTQGADDWCWGGIIRQHGGPVKYCGHKDHESAAEARACAQRQLDGMRAMGTHPCRDHFPDEASGLLIDGEYVR